MRASLVVSMAIAAALLTGPPAVAGSPDTGGRTLTPAMFGAQGDGVADDTGPLQRALDALRSGDTLLVPEGRTYLHTAVLRVGVPDVRITGSGTLLAGDERRSEVLLDADRVMLDGGLQLRMRQTTRRWDAFEQMKLRLGDHDGIVVRDVSIVGSAAAGIYVGTGAGDFLLEDVTVRDTRADGIHITGGAHDGVVRWPVVQGTGDDGVAVVSYGNEPAPVRRVVVISPRISDNHWGRGIGIVGGEDITVWDPVVRRSSAAAVYIASEGAPYNTYAPRRVRILGGWLEGSNTDATVNHGAILVYAGRAGYAPTDVTVSGTIVQRTRATAPFQVAVIADTGAAVSRVLLKQIDVRGGGDVFYANVPSSAYERRAWTIDGTPFFV